MKMESFRAAIKKNNHLEIIWCAVLRIMGLNVYGNKKFKHLTFAVLTLKPKMCNDYLSFPKIIQYINRISYHFKFSYKEL